MPEEGLPIAATVTRTGGVAGIRRRWTAEPPAPEAPRWTTLIEECPWELVVKTTGADRFVWQIHAVCGPDEREALLGDQQVAAPWRELIDEVREFGAS